jgi:hypothetical protein
VQHLDAGLEHRRVVRALEGERAQPRRGVEAARRIGPHVELDLPHALQVELLGQRREAVLERGLVDQAGADAQRLLGRAGLDVVAVVRPDDLDLVQPDRAGSGAAGPEQEHEERGRREGRLPQRVPG